MNLLRNKQTYQNPKICYISKEKFENKYIKNRKYFKDKDHCHYTREYIVAVHSICKSKHIVHKLIPIAFDNGCNYEYYRIIKELSEELTCLRGNTEK